MIEYCHQSILGEGGEEEPGETSVASLSSARRRFIIIIIIYIFIWCIILSFFFMCVYWAVGEIFPNWMLGRRPSIVDLHAAINPRKCNNKPEKCEWKFLPLRVIYWWFVAPMPVDPSPIEIPIKHQSFHRLSVSNVSIRGSSVAGRSVGSTSGRISTRRV